MTPQEIKDMNAKEKLTPDDYKNDARVLAALEKLQALKSKEFSDVLDDKNNQYVNLVQKGGGVLGVALVGYTFILEQAGLRFLKLAGTSAGAINTSLLVIPGAKSEPKSDILLTALSDLDLFRLVDGHWAARFIIKRFVKEPDFTKRLKTIILVVVAILALLLITDFIALGLQHSHPVWTNIGLASFICTGLYLLVLAISFSFIGSLLGRLRNSGWGINPGDFFYDWVKHQMRSHGVKTASDLKKKAAEPIPGLHLRPNTFENNLDGIEGSVTFITSDLVTENKFELPRMSNLFRTSDQLDTLEPAGFVRASMSIPLFFESYYIRDIPQCNAEVDQLWKDTFGLETPPHMVRFVDGGMLSNFPINLFYNEKIIVPRLPTFGIDLDDTLPENKQEDAASWSFGGYAGKMINTMKSYYDKDFMLKNSIMGKGVGKVGVSQFNWLNFFLTNAQKIDLFATGAEAAVKFLEGFDWQEYKNHRKHFHDEQVQKTKK